MRNNIQDDIARHDRKVADRGSRTDETRLRSVVHPDRKKANELQVLVARHDGLAYQYTQHAATWSEGESLRDLYLQVAEAHSKLRAGLQAKADEFDEAARSERG